MAELKQSDLESLKNIVTEFEGKPSKQLGTELYHLCSALMPSVNVDVMVRNTSGILLCWRHDNFYGPGWHVPGGVMRHKETLQERVKAVLIGECGIALGSADIGDPYLVSELFHKERCIRGHFISMLYVLDERQIIENGGALCSAHDRSSMQSFTQAPDNIISQQKEVYGPIIEQICGSS